MRNNGEGWTKTTCSEAKRQQSENPNLIVWWRPNGPQNPPYSDDDEAWVR